LKDFDVPILQRIYAISGTVATGFLALVAAIIVAHIFARFFGSHLPSADEFAAWSMAASFFLALPDALFKGAHIRVTLLLLNVPLRFARLLDVVSTSFALVLFAWAAWHIGAYTYDSYSYDVRSQGILPTPLWIPQMAMVYGSCLTAIGFADRLQRVLRGLPVVFPEIGPPNDGLRES
jgi:TRAP-type C4-dicarboxylate transport system permease small subunit